MTDLMEAVTGLAKRRGIAFQSAEIYGGLRSSWDYGPLGVELRRNIRERLVAGHRAAARRRRRHRGRDHHEPPRLAGERATSTTFHDPLVECTNCHQRFREDHLEAERRRRGALPELRGRGVHRAEAVQPDAEDVPRAGRGRRRRRLPAARDGAGHVRELPGDPDRLAQEAAVRHRADRQVVPQRDHAGQLHLPHARVRADGDGVLRRARHRRGVVRVLGRAAHAVVHSTSACRQEKLRLRAHEPDELAHYAKAATDIEYEFPFGWQELEGIANRTDYDLDGAPGRERRGPDLLRPGARATATCRTWSSRRPASTGRC